MNDIRLYQSPLLVRFSHCDPAGIVFFPQYLVMLNNLVEDWVSECLGISYSQMILKRRIGMPTVSLNCEFSAVSRLGDEVTMELAIARLGDKSLALDIGCRGADGPRMRVKQVIVFTSLDTHRAIAVPDDFRAAMLRFDARTGAAG